MDGNPAEVIGVSLEGLDLVHRVVVVHTNRRIIRATHDPLLPGYKLGYTNREVPDLE